MDGYKWRCEIRSMPFIDINHTVPITSNKKMQKFTACEIFFYNTQLSGNWIALWQVRSTGKGGKLRETVTSFHDLGVVEPKSIQYVSNESSITCHKKSYVAQNSPKKKTRSRLREKKCRFIKIENGIMQRRSNLKNGRFSRCHKYDAGEGTLQVNRQTTATMTLIRNDLSAPIFQFEKTHLQKICDARPHTERINCDFSTSNRE